MRVTSAGLHQYLITAPHFLVINDNSTPWCLMNYKIAFETLFMIWINWYSTLWMELLKYLHILSSLYICGWKYWLIHICYHHYTYLLYIYESKLGFYSCDTDSPHRVLFCYFSYSKSSKHSLIWSFTPICKIRASLSLQVCWDGFPLPI